MPSYHPYYFNVSRGSDSNIEKIERGEYKFEPRKLLAVDTPDKDLIQQAKEWKIYSEPYEKEWRDKAKKYEDYYLGRQRTEYLTSKNEPIGDNIIFQATETFLPKATAKNPEPVVENLNNKEGIRVSHHIKTVLQKEADRQVLRMKLKKLTRHWSIYLVGAIKVGWDNDIDDIETEVIRPQNLILDPDCVIAESGEYTGEYLGHKRNKSAEALMKMFGDKGGVQKAIRDKVKGEMGTKVQYIEWWTKDMVFWMMDDVVLGKSKNIYWNYAEEGDRFNHFYAPKVPFVFLTVFNLGLGPVDDTGLIAQNIKNQNIVNDRLFQISRNIDNMNNSLVVSGDAVPKDQAGEAVARIARGDAIWVPKGIDVSRAVVRFPVQSLPADAYNQMVDIRNEMLNIYGVKGSTPDGISKESTVRGKIITRDLDDSRIGGSITESIEQVADMVYNWWVQLMFVFFEPENYERYLGKRDTDELLEGLVMADERATFIVSVKDGSMIPKDPMTKRNEAVDLWGAGAIDPLSLMERLDDPDPKVAALKLMQYQLDPASYIQKYLSTGETDEGQAITGELPMTQPTTPEPVEAPQDININQVPIE